MNTHITIMPTAKIEILPDRELRVVSGSAQDPAGYVLSEIGAQPPLHEALSHEMISTMIAEGSMRIEHGWYEEGRAKARLIAGVSHINQCPPHERAEIMRRDHYIREFLKREATDKEVKRTDASIEATLKAIDEGNEPKGRCDQEKKTYKRPSARTFRRWLSRFEDNGHDILALRSGHRRSGNTLSQMHPEAIRLLNKHVGTYCDERRWSIKKVYGNLVSDVKNLNAERLVRAAPPIDCPAKSTLADRIKGLNAFEVYASRYGIPAARAKFAINSGGLDVDRPLQHVQIDEWKIQLHTIVDGLGIGEFFTEKDRIKLQKERLKVCVAIDIATRCVIGMRISRRSDAENAIATLAMMVADKTDIAKAAGCLSGWFMCGPPGIISPDAGGQFIDEDFRARIADLKCGYENAPAGLSHLRGHIERLFGTMHTTLIEEFPGRSFAHVVDKGDYKAEDRAAIFSRDLPKIFVRYVVDWYHHTPHAGLGGETPYCAWQRLAARYGVDAPPNPHQRREIFGIELERALDQNGVRVAGLYYQSTAIQHLRRQVGDTKVRVRFDETDIGHVSVWVGEAWVTVPSVRQMVRGLHLDVWLESVRDLKRRFAASARMYEHIVHEAIRAISKMANDAMARVSIDRTRPTVEELDRTEAGLLLGFNIEDDVAGADETGTGILGNGIPVAKAQPPVTPRPAPNPPAARPDSEDDYGLED